DLLNWPSITGAGQKFRMRIQYGTQRKDFILNLTEPYFLDRKLSLSGQLFYTEANYLSSVYDQRNYGFSIEARKPINAFMYASLGYRLQDIDIYNVSSGASAAIKAQKGSLVESEVFANLSAAEAWHGQRSSSLFLSSRKRAPRSFMTPVSSIAMRGILVLITLPPISALEFASIYRLVRCVSTTEFHFKRMGTPAAGSSTSMSVINFERI